MIRASIGIRDKLETYANELNELARTSARLIERIEAGQSLDPYSEVYEFQKVVPIFGITHESYGYSIRLGEDTEYAGTERIRIDYEKPVEGLLHLACIFSTEWSPSRDLGEYDEWQIFAANWLEIEHRKEHGIAETDGLTAWLLLLEGSRKIAIDHEKEKAEIIAALNERRLITGKAAEVINAGYQKVAKEAPRWFKSHWDYPVERRASSIGQINIRQQPGYGDVQIESTVIFSRKLNLGTGSLVVETPILPTAAIMAIQGKPIEKIIDDTRLHHWNIVCKNVESQIVKIKGEEKNELTIRLNRSRPEARVCFQIY